MQLSGGGVFQMPTSVTVMPDPATEKLFKTDWQAPTFPVSIA
jgi:hypothetical protein